MTAFSQLSDEQLVKESTTSQDAIRILIQRYSGFVLARASLFSNSFNETDDLMQEGLMALVSAITTYDLSSVTKFSTYAYVCINNRMKSFISRNISCAGRIDYQIEEYSEVSPENILLEKEKIEQFAQIITRHLSDSEWRIFRLYLKGSTYDNMARHLNITTKAVDNAMQRVRRKLKRVWRADNID